MTGVIFPVVIEFMILVALGVLVYTIYKITVTNSDDSDDLDY